MGVTRVTISGADDAVDVRDLAKLAEEFPFLELGILRSEKREGTPRYPSAAWRASLEEARLSVAVHLCGKRAIDALAGDDNWWWDDALTPHRVQLNGASDFRLPKLHLATENPEVEWILQATSMSSFVEQWGLIERNEHPNVSVLFDQSCGTGKPITIFPTHPKIRVGYAGGIGPDNVLEVLQRVGRYEGNTWIDMESGVRTADCFDLEKVRRVLEIAAPVIGADER